MKDPRRAPQECGVGRTNDTFVIFHWVPFLAMCSAVLTQYLLFLVPAVVCGSHAEGTVYGSVFAFAFVTSAGLHYHKYPETLTKYIFIGALGTLVPASYAASSQMVVARLSEAILAYGESNSGLDPGLGFAHATADLFALRDLSSTNFRFDLIGQAHTTLVTTDTSKKIAGASASGTYCAVPIVPDGWTKAQAVPFWYLCDNDWKLFRDCSLAYNTSYTTKDWYGLADLNECLRKPEELMEAARESEGGSSSFVMYFDQIDFASTFVEHSAHSNIAIMQASIKHHIVVRDDAPKVRLASTQVPCCEAQIAKLRSDSLAISLGVVMPMIFISACVSASRALSRGTAGGPVAFWTRKELKFIRSGNLGKKCDGILTQI